MIVNSPAHGASISDTIKSYNCEACKKENVSSLCGRCKKVAYCDRDCQKTHWTAHKAFCQSEEKSPWYENDKLWDTKAADPRLACVRRAKNFVLNVEQHVKNAPELNYFIISKNLNNVYLSEPAPSVNKHRRLT